MLKILISAPYMILEIDRYRDIFKENNMDIIIPKVNERLEEKELIKQIRDIDGVICGDDRFTKKVIDNANKLKVIVKWGTGMDSIDKLYAEKNGIKVYNTPNAFSEPVSDTVMAYMLAFARKIVELDDLMKKGRWQKLRGLSLNESSLGIIGVGNVGSMVAKKANAFGMKIYGNDIKKISDKIIRRYNIEMVELNYLLKKSDFISVNCDLNSSSHHLLDMEKLKLMKKSAVLINTARGPIIKENDLIYALENNFLKGAALDVFEKEPLPIDNPLRSMHNVLLASHNANSSSKYWEKVHENSINMLLKGLKEVR